MSSRLPAGGNSYRNLVALRLCVWRAPEARHTLAQRARPERSRSVSAGCVIYKTPSTGGAADFVAPASSRLFFFGVRHVSGCAADGKTHKEALANVEIISRHSSLATSSSPHLRPARPPAMHAPQAEALNGS